jgi:DNA-binding transcriptional ArsR family regulator
LVGSSTLRSIVATHYFHLFPLYWAIKNLFISSLYRNIAMKRLTMGLTKSEIFTDKQNKLAGMMKALAHPARIAIIQYLIKANACVNGQLVEELGLAQPTISQHLKELKNAGLIQGTIEGTSVCYCIDPRTWAQYQKEFGALFAAYKGGESCNC